MFQVPEIYRIKKGRMATNESFGNNGAFDIKKGVFGSLFAIASDDRGWEHVSVTVQGEKRVPIWDEMHYIKDMFWDEEDCVMQLHPPKSRYVNFHPYCLHLWRPVDMKIPQPDVILVR